MQLTSFSKMMSSEKTKCCKCRSEVKNGDSICCSICNVWHHLRCSGLSKEEFLQHTRNKNLFGNVLSVLFIGVGNVQGFLANVVVSSVTAVTNGFTKSIHF